MRTDSDTRDCRQTKSQELRTLNQTALITALKATSSFHFTSVPLQTQESQRETLKVSLADLTHL